MFSSCTVHSTPKLTQQSNTGQESAQHENKHAAEAGQDWGWEAGL